MPHRVYLRLTPLVAALFLIAPICRAQGAQSAPDEKVDWDMITRIRLEGFDRSQVMQTLEVLTDVLGPRLTGSPQMRAANEWTRDRLSEWGLENAHLESWGTFGRGWSWDSALVRVVAPRSMQLLAAPKAWTPGTDGPVRAEVVGVGELDSPDDLDEYAGELAGKILLVGEPRELDASGEPLFDRFDEEELDEVSAYRIRGPRRRDYRRMASERYRKQQKLRQRLIDEQVLAVMEASARNNGVLLVGGGGSREPGVDPGPTSLVLAAEHFNMLKRLLERGPVELEIDVAARFFDDDLDGYNTLAEIPGAPGGGLVMLGAHLDSWHGGTGATDNAAGVAVAMEAVRILQTLGVRPNHTIRIALWGGEEQGLLGSRGYVRQHFASRKSSDDPAEEDLPPYLRSERGPLTFGKEYERLSAYFNLDNGTGRIRGIYLQQNAAVQPIFKAWLEPFADLGATTLTMNNTGGTDHLAFDIVGLPGFQFIQDEVEYSTLTHHTNLDLYDHLQPEDMMQASVIMASFLYHAAMREERLPRKPLQLDEDEPEANGEAAAPPEATGAGH